MAIRGGADACGQTVRPGEHRAASTTWQFSISYLQDLMILDNQNSIPAQADAPGELHNPALGIAERTGAVPSHTPPLIRGSPIFIPNHLMRGFRVGVSPSDHIHSATYLSSTRENAQTISEVCHACGAERISPDRLGPLPSSSTCRVHISP